MKKNFYLLAFFILVILEFVLGFLLLPQKLVNSQLKYERIAIANKCTKEEQKSIAYFAIKTENTIIYNSGLNKKIREIFIPSQEEYSNSRFISSLGKPFFDWIAKRFTVLSLIFHGMLLRLGFLKIYFFPLFLIFISSVLTGMMDRRIKIFNFALSSSVKFQLALRAIKFILATMILSLMWPLYLHPDFLFLSFLSVCLLVVKLTANFQKRI